MARLISGFEALLAEQDGKGAGRPSAPGRVTAAKPAARSGERAAPRRAGSRPEASKPAAKTAAASAKAGSRSPGVGGRTRTRQAS
jgi:hypothetical protein